MVFVQLKPGREKSLLRRHPWIFSGAVDEIRGSPSGGETVEVHSASGEFLALGAYSPKSQIRIRVWSWQKDQVIGPQFFRARLERSLAARQALIDSDQTNALRLVHGESDGLPGLVVDRYADTLVVQCLSMGIEHWRGLLFDLLAELTGVDSVFERSDVEIRRLEGLPIRMGLVSGSEPPIPLTIFENELNFLVDIKTGHKTGFYLDQRSNRNRVGGFAHGRDVLDCFSYSGGFTLSALAGGAKSVLAVDTSSNALSLARENLALNGMRQDRVNFEEGNVFQVLRSMRDQGRSFDLIVLDPPKFAPTASQAKHAARGYKDINLLSFKLLRPGGLLATFSCSGGISADLFQKIVAGAALDAGVEAQILERLHQGSDHPVALNFPEGAYLKGLLVRVQ